MPSLVMRRFAYRLDALSARTPDPERLAVGVGDMLAHVLEFDHVLERSEMTPDPNRYRQHVLHVDPDGRFSVLALVWLPGQLTPIHDHVAWCVAGILKGRELEHRFTGLPDGRLRQGERIHNEIGEVSVLTAGPDIHKVACASDDVTVSIHVYGADITRRGTSINLTYDPARVLVPELTAG